MPHDLEKFMRCEWMQRFPAAFEPRRPCATPHDEKSVRSEEAPRFPQEPYRIPISFDAVKKRHNFEGSSIEPG